MCLVSAFKDLIAAQTILVVFHPLLLCSVVPILHLRQFQLFDLIQLAAQRIRL